MAFVHSHLGQSTVRAIAVDSTRGLRRGGVINSDGQPLTRRSGFDPAYLVRQSGHGGVDGDLLSGHRVDSHLCQPFFNRRRLERMRAESRTTAKQESDALLAATRAQLERERTALQRDMLNLEKSQITRLAGVLASAAHVIIKRFFEQLEEPELEQLLLKSACRELTLLSAHAFGPTTIESATSLDTEAQQTIALAMGAHQTTTDFPWFQNCSPASALPRHRA
jgi:hypothetical protein